MQSKNATTMATRRRNALLVVVIVLIVAGTVAVRLIADRMEDDAAAAASRQVPATTQQAPAPETDASATPATSPQVAPAADPATTSSPAQPQTGYVPDGRPADSPTVPLSCAAGETLVTNGVKWTFDVPATYDQSVLGMAASELKSFVSALPESDRSIHIRGFAATDGLWTYALGLGPGDATKKIMRCSATNCLFPSITDDESGAWVQLVPNASATQ